MAPSFLLFLASFLATTLALPAAEVPKEASTSSSSSSTSSIIQSRADAYEWTALGDSYASGVGAGHMDDGSQRCMRFSDAYPRLMQTDDRMPGGADRKINNVVCSGAQAKDVLEQQFYDTVHIPPITDTTQAQFGPRPPFGKPRIATLSIGGNDIDLKGLIMNCVYQFFPTHTCATQQDMSWKKINSPDLVDGIDAVIKKTVAKGREGPAGEDFRLYVTGYGKLFNDATTQCDGVTFAWWGNNWPSFGYKMTQERRKDFNNMADKLNEAVAAAVARNANDKVTFVPWDDALDGDEHGGHRYCEERVTEPDHNNPSVWFWQNADHSDQLVGSAGPFFDALARKIDPTVSDWAGLKAKYAPADGSPPTDGNFRGAGRTTDEIYDFMYQVAAEKADLIDTGFWQMLANIFRVFHPKADLHKVIAQRILDKVEADNNPAISSTLPIPTGQQASCGADLNPNFPKFWVLLDGYHSASEILFRMREQACQGSCKDIQGVPGSLIQAKKQGENGCEYAVKIAAKKELYFYATGSGKNCYTATEIAINQCAATKDAGWINGPNFGEFYQVGVRDVNGANNHHDPFPDTNDHLGYRQVACKQVSPSLLWDRFEVQICDWDDSQFGRTIRDEVGSCGLQTEWKFEDSTFKFADGYSAQKYASLRMPTVAGRKCITHKIEEALGLSQGSVTCNNKWNEVSMF